jgi:hypothetical protein
VTVVFLRTEVMFFCCSFMTGAESQLSKKRCASFAHRFFCESGISHIETVEGVCFALEHRAHSSIVQSRTRILGRGLFEMLSVRRDKSRLRNFSPSRVKFIGPQANRTRCVPTMTGEQKFRTE